MRSAGLTIVGFLLDLHNPGCLRQNMHDYKESTRQDEVTVFLNGLINPSVQRLSGANHYFQKTENALKLYYAHQDTLLTS